MENNNNFSDDTQFSNDEIINEINSLPNIEVSPENYFEYRSKTKDNLIKRIFSDYEAKVSLLSAVLFGIIIPLFIFYFINFRNINNYMKNNFNNYIASHSTVQNKKNSETKLLEIPESQEVFTETGESKIYDDIKIVEEDIYYTL